MSAASEQQQSAGGASLEPLLRRASQRGPLFAPDFVSALLQAARAAAASDIHIDPTAQALRVSWRLDGVLQHVGDIPRESAASVIARLKVLAGLLTYETSLPQEGRIWDDALRVEVRVSTFPTLHGERAVLRLLGASRETLDSLEQLGLPAEVRHELTRQLAGTSRAILIAGPAASGKTTTAYACLRHIVAQFGGGRSVASLEDPVEADVAGVVQSQVHPAAGFDMATGLKSLLRLDPEVIFIGEMRDRATAEIALQAALTGQLVLTTFHAGHALEAWNRLLDMGIPLYAVRNAVRLVVAQRLVRRLCTCALPGDVDRDARPFGLDVRRCQVAGACEGCQHTGYRGRTLIAEWKTGDVAGLDTPPGGEAFWPAATSLVEAGVTSAAEVVRVLGLRQAEGGTEGRFAGAEN